MALIGKADWWWKDSHSSYR